MLSSTNDKMAARLMLYMRGWAVSAAIIEENGAFRREDCEGRGEREGKARTARDDSAAGFERLAPVVMLAA
jgi:hypothetical protein